MSGVSAPERMGFQAEVKQLLHLMVHSLYSHPEIFLRELISNASDACDKLRFEALNNSALYENDTDLKIRVDFDPEARTLSVIDNGIGMSREEAIQHLGTIAKSGTREFFSQLTGDQQKDAHLIGQFGVGFYSAFIVADKVTVRSRRAGLPAALAVRWESEGSGDFSVDTIERAERGTEIILHVKSGQEEFLSRTHLTAIIRKYSDHIMQPILMKKEEWDEQQKSYRRGADEEAINQAKALWARPKSEITAEQYKEFYKHVGHDFDEPLAWVHSKVEGKSDYTQLLYIPSHRAFDVWDRNQRHGVKLYVRRVFIMDDAEQLMPAYLRFVRGVVDSSDLPLNVSREILQESKVIETIRAAGTRKILGLLEELASNDPEKYRTFWKEFGSVLKEGIGEDYANRERLAKLLRFSSTQLEREEPMVSLNEYVGRMKPGQDNIYFIAAHSFNAAKHSPHLEVFQKKGVEVLLLCDRIDEWVMEHLREFEGKPLRSVAKGGLDLGKLEDAVEKEKQQQEASAFEELVQRIKKSIGDKVKDVRVSHRLVDSPSCLVSDEHDPSTHLSRILKAAGQKVPETKPILEINPAHPLVAQLRHETTRFDVWVAVLFDQAWLSEGGQLDDPSSFVKRINELMLAMKCSSSDLI